MSFSKGILLMTALFALLQCNGLAAKRTKTTTAKGSCSKFVKELRQIQQNAAKPISRQNVEIMFLPQFNEFLSTTFMDLLSLSAHRELDFLVLTDKGNEVETFLLSKQFLVAEPGSYENLHTNFPLFDPDEEFRPNGFTKALLSFCKNHGLRCGVRAISRGKNPTVVSRYEADHWTPELDPEQSYFFQLRIEWN
ncbi:MAG: hypothetical protein AB7F43_03455 [Bacteriovoracia bacterium]